MKKILLALLIALSPIFASAQMNVGAGGTGTSTFPTNWFVIGNTATKLTATGTPYFSNFSATNGTITNLTVTNCTGCLTGAFKWPFTKQSNGDQATSTTMDFFGGILSTASSTINLVQIPNLTSNGLIRTSGSTGILSVDTTSYSTFAWPFTKQAGGEQATSTIMEFTGGFLSNASSTINASLLLNGNVRIANAGFVGFAGSTAVDSTNYSLFGNTTLTLLNARTGASIGFRIANADVANFTTTGGFGFGSTFYNLDPGQNNMIVEGNLGVGIAVPTEKLHVSGGLLVSGNSTTTNLLALGSTTLQNFTFQNATGTNLNLTGNAISFGTAPVYIASTTGGSVSLASTTIGMEGHGYNAGTTTVIYKTAHLNTKMLGFYCVASTTGVALVRWGDDAGNYAETGYCTGRKFVPVSSNNTWLAGEDITIQASSTWSVPYRIYITPVWQTTSY